jgi:hypothetical protein
MQEHKIIKEDGTDINWTIARNTSNNNYFCLLYNDNKKKYTFTPNENLNCELFMIGGGGAGGYFFGGGGGAGASYINNNYTFKKNKTYTFEIGNGGMCDIVDINKLFKSGLILNIYNNTNINLLNVNFTNNDYSSLGIQNSGMMQSFNVNNITIPSSIFHNNTTYIWDGYIKTNSTGYFNVAINSKIKTIIWVDKFVYNNDNALIEGNNINDVKIIQLESNRFYNIKIIAYNDNNNSNNFNISFDGCQLFNFDKNEETYVYEPATDTVLSYRNDDNTFETIRCKGGGNGGCGFFNKNTNLDGGCGGGSGINKIKGSSIIGAIYNGYDGAVGDYCGGGGGIMSAGRNNIGGDGKIINWFNETLIFGAGGNAANLSENRNLGYGCGGNGGECCYYSKLLINNNGNNGCILIYVNSSSSSTSSSQIIEGFANKSEIMLSNSSIAKKLIDDSFKLFTFNNNYGLSGYPTRNAFFEDKNSYMDILDDVSGTYYHSRCNYLVKDNFKNQTFIYDMLVISKLYAIIYRLYWHQFNIVCSRDLKKWKNFCDNAQIKFTEEITGDNLTKIDGFTIHINNLFDISSLNINSSDVSNYNNIYTASNKTAMNNTLITDYCKSFEITGTIQPTAYVPFYHNTVKDAGTNKYVPLTYLKEFYNNEITTNKYNKIVIGPNSSGDTAITATTPPTDCDNGSGNTKVPAYANPGSTTININDANGYVTRNILKTYYNAVSLLYDTDYQDYYKQRVFIYLEALNIIFNTDSTNILTTLNFNMHYYNLVVYNASIQYGLVKIFNDLHNNPTMAQINNKVCYTNPATDPHHTYGGFLNVTAHGTVSGGGSATITGILIAVSNLGVLSTIDASNATKNPSEATFTGSDLILKVKKYTLNGNGGIVETIVNIGTITAAKATTNGTSANQNRHNDSYSLALDSMTTDPATSPISNTGFIPDSCYNSTTTATFPAKKLGSLYTITPGITNGSETSSEELNTDLATITSNINAITENLKAPENFIKVKDNISNTSLINNTTTLKFYENQQLLNKTIYDYNGELENYNNMAFYYKIVVAFAILLIIIIIFIFSANSIDNNSKISIYVILIVMIIIAYLIYKHYSEVKESFTVINDKKSSVQRGNLSDAILKTTINGYKLATEKYLNSLILSLLNTDISENLQTSLNYIKKLTHVKNDKAELYNIKKENLINSMEILKKSVNFYYYMIIAIFVSIIILIIALILYLLNPAMIMQIIILCVIPFIALIYGVSYYIHKSTRLAENKNYWANYNPSSTTLDLL